MARWYIYSASKRYNHKIRKTQLSKCECLFLQNCPSKNSLYFLYIMSTPPPPPFKALIPSTVKKVSDIPGPAREGLVNDRKIANLLYSAVYYLPLPCFLTINMSLYHVLQDSNHTINIVLVIFWPLQGCFYQNNTYNTVNEGLVTTQ
jgi:hypothetical protein